MTYTKTVWTDRVVSTPNKYTKSSETTTSVTLVADPGTVTQAGTPINAANLNKMEQGIADALPKDGSQPMTGPLLYGGTSGRQIGAGIWADMSSDDGGTVIFSNNAYRDFGAANVYKYSNTHAILGARGILIDWNQAPNAKALKYFETGQVASTAGATFTPTVYDIWTSAQLRINVDHLEWNNGGTWQGVGGVKNVQRGSAVIPDGLGNIATVNVTIAAVNLSKSYVNFPGAVLATSSSNSVSRARLTSSTNLEISANTAVTTTVYWEVIESY